MQKEANLILYGLKAVGKSTVGRLLAEKMNWSFVDLDREIEALYQEKQGLSSPLSCRELFVLEGEDVFRSLESLAVARVSSRSGQVISVGGGCLLCEKNHQMLKGENPIRGFLVFLQADQVTLESRMKKDGWPAYLDQSEFGRVFLERMNRYTPLANCCVQTGASHPEEVVEEVYKKWKEWNGKQ